jgi:hypothetical protein
MKKVVAPFITILALILAVPAGASVVTSLPGGTVVPMPVIDCSSPNFGCFGPGPFTFGPGITWSSTNDSFQGGSLFGYDGSNLGPYRFSSNGNWTGALGPMAVLNDSTDSFGSTDTMTFAFATPVAAVGGFLNYVPSASTATIISVYDASGNLIEPSFNLTFVTSGANDTGRFYGFQESSPVISYFTLTDNYVGITNLTIASTPEPATWLLCGSGLLGLIGYGRRKIGL